MSLKILIAGAFATGKTTLAHKVLTEFYQLEIDSKLLPDVSRSCPYPLNQHQTVDISLWLLSEQIRQEVEAEVRKPQLILCDRGIPDIISHTLTLSITSTEAKKKLAIFLAIAYEWYQTYDIIFWSKLDPDRNIIDDGLRVIDKEYQQLLEDKIANTFDKAARLVILPAQTNERVQTLVTEVSVALLRLR